MSECDDAHWPRDDEEFVGSSYRLAVSDGATESSFSGLWAKLLVRAYGRGEMNDPVSEGELRRSRTLWSAHVARKRLPWYAEEKVSRGAFATLLGVEFNAGRDSGIDGEWSALAVGDTCVVQVRDDEPLVCFPLTQAWEFAARPHLLTTRADGSDDLVSHIRRHIGAWRSGDAFYVMTDALSAWFMAGIERGERPWQRFQDLETTEERMSFVDLVADLRDSHAMKNDDVTLVRVDFA